MSFVKQVLDENKLEGVRPLEPLNKFVVYSDYLFLFLLLLISIVLSV